MEKTPFVTNEKLKEITDKFPTPFHLYDEEGIRKNCEAVKKAFAWNKGYREYFAVKALPNPFILKIFKEYGFGCDCASETELMLAKALDFAPDEIMFSSNDMLQKSMPSSTLMILHIFLSLKKLSEASLRLSAAATIRAEFTRSATASWITPVMLNTVSRKPSFSRLTRSLRRKVSSTSVFILSLSAIR